MKSLKFLIMLMALCLSAGLLYAQQQEDTIEKSIALDNEAANELLIKNVNGSVSVEGYTGNTIEVVASRKISAKSQKKLQQGIEEIKVGVKEEAGQVVIYMDAPFAELEKNHDGWSYQVHENNLPYDYELELKLRVPDRLRMKVSTVNGERVHVQNFAGSLEARNVNGSVELEQVSGNSSAKTVNGNIVASMETLPEAGLEFNTVNGNIELFFPADLAADIAYKTINGDFYTDFEDITHKGATVNESDGHNRSAKVYRVGRKSILSLNGGGELLELKTISGDIYLQKQK